MAAAQDDNVRADALLETARAWLDAEPDDDIRQELQDMVSGDRGALEAAFSGHLTFGTAGLRAPIGPGPSRMNRLVVRQAAAGFVEHLLAHDPRVRERGILIGFDARHKSREFARDTARVAAARGVQSRLFEMSVPTPVLAWNVTRLEVAGAVMVTASHNPPQDNGYKVYLATGAQIVSPTDEEIERSIRAVDPLHIELADEQSPFIVHLDARDVDCYVDWVPSVRLCPDIAAVPISYTALHGVGGDVAVRALRRSGFGDVHVVAEQHEPDPNFPTVAFPNPEEPGAMDLVMQRARHTGSQVALANDPDADRLGVAIPTRDGSWRRLSGDEIGWLMGDHVLRHTQGEDRLVVTTLVSSSLLGDMARDHGVAFEETFTGFKWIAAAVDKHPDRRLVFAYEQALGYLVASRPLDKDGITAAVVMAEIAALAAHEGVSLEDRLDDIAVRYGQHITVESSVKMPPARAAARVRALVDSPPSQIHGRTVLEVVSIPEASLVRMILAGQKDQTIRVQVRPSGTEPKVKIYAEAVGEDPGPFLDGMVELLA